MSVYERLRELGRLSESGFAGFLGFSGCSLSRGTDLVGRAFARDVCAFTRVYESLRVVWTAVHAVCVMGCDLNLAGAGVLVPLPARVVRELYQPLHGGSCFGGNMAEIAEMAEKLGRSGYIFFAVLVVVTLLHQFFRFRSQFPVLAGSLRCSSTALTDDRLMPVCWRWGQCVGSGRVMSAHVGLGRG